MTGTLAGKHVLVTGAGRGIGRATALAFAREGCALTLVARSADALASVATECDAAGALSSGVEALDLCEPDALEELCETLLPHVDVLVNNAGTAPSAALEKTSDDLWDDTLELNLRVPFALCRAALPHMAERGWGRVLNVASTAALEGFAYTSAYVASKHGLLGLTRALAAEAAARWRDADLGIAAVCPGFVDTDIVATSVKRLVDKAGISEADARAKLAAMNAGGELLSPEQVAARLLALAAEQPAVSKGAAVVFGPDAP
ncbi:MAG: 3-hydroxyacyl-CoA dehydrogenase [Planctomycetota bacterium]|nr:MAG: 3-hydroxyacyl-CoA dehydrogenase [Planctomycetota bacterium]